MTHSDKQEGFTTVELLISLFIAAAFIATGFQLFSIVTKDSSEARLRAKAASIINTTIQERSSLAPSPCGTPPAPSALTIPTTDLPQASGTVTFSCPYGPSSTTTRIKVVVNYGQPQKTVEGGLDVTR